MAETRSSVKKNLVSPGFERLPSMRAIGLGKRPLSF